MVHKIRLVFLFVIFVFLIAVSFFKSGNVETNLLKTLLPQNIPNSSEIISVTNKYSSVIKVVFEADSQENLENLESNFKKEIDTGYFELNKPDVSELLNKYLSQPTNFLSHKTRKLLKEKKYDEIYTKSLENLYNPVGIQLTTLDKDPYLLFDDFILSNKKISDNNEGEYYDFLSLKLKNNEALSPDLSNKKIKELIKIQKKFSNQSSKIYLAGTPIHSYYTSRRSVADINVICILSTLMIIFLTYRYFKNLKLLLPIALSIMFGMLSGYVATRLFFDDFQVITMVFSATLIGIGIDYSYHYFFADKIDYKFVKNLSFSLLTTIVPFILLYFTEIELLKQVAVFSIFGLIGIYSVVLFIYPCFKISTAYRKIIPNFHIYKFLLLLFCFLGIVGVLRFKFNDNLTALYSPSKGLKKAEMLYSKISDENNEKTQFISVKGFDIENIIQTEENITNELDKDNIEYMSISKFIPSKSRQRENFELVKDLYQNNLDNYSNILSLPQINHLKNKTFEPVFFEIDKYPYLKDFMLDENTSIIFAFTDKKLNISNEKSHVINFVSDIEVNMKHYRQLLLFLLPLVILILWILLAILYDYKKAIKILLPSIFGLVLSILLTSLIYGEINLFSVITLFLVVGFTMDYSIFRNNRGEKTETAIFVSCLTTSFSFLLLSFSGFKLLKLMATVLFFGIVISYIAGFLVFKKGEGDENNKA